MVLFLHPGACRPTYAVNMCLGSESAKFFLLCHFIEGICAVIHFKRADHLYLVLNCQENRPHPAPGRAFFPFWLPPILACPIGSSTPLLRAERLLVSVAVRRLFGITVWGAWAIRSLGLSLAQRGGDRCG